MFCKVHFFYRGVFNKVARTNIRALGYVHVPNYSVLTISFWIPATCILCSEPLLIATQDINRPDEQLKMACPRRYPVKGIGATVIKGSSMSLPAHQLFDELRERAQNEWGKGKGPAHLGADDP